MRAVLDEGVPRDLMSILSAHGCSVASFPNEWRGLKNGRLLSEMKSRNFDILLTCDKNLRFQQNFRYRVIGLIVLPGTRLAELLPVSEVIATTVLSIAAGEIIVIGRDGRTATVVE